MTSTKLLALACISAACRFQAAAFVPSHGAFSPRSVEKPNAGSTLRATELNPIDEMCIENVAEFCLHETCDLEEYEALVNQLEAQREYMINHVAQVESLLHRLKSSNHPEHDPQDVEDLVGAIKDTLAATPLPEAPQP
jgi:hypothetical protein